MNEDFSKIANASAAEVLSGETPVPLALLVDDDNELVCPHCGASDVVEHAVESEYREVWISNTYYDAEGHRYHSLDRKSIDVNDVEPSTYECDKCHTAVALPEGVA